MLELDIRDRPRVLDALTTHAPSTVVHLAASVGVRPSVESPQPYIDTNVAGTRNVRDAAASAGVRHLVFSSSSSVYGAASVDPSHEDDPLRPRSPYAQTKIDGEHIVRGFEGTVSIARLFTVYGPQMRRDLAVRQFAEKIAANLPIAMLGDGTSRRDYTHVGDVVAGLVAAIERRGSRVLTCNLGTGRSVALRDVIGLIETTIGRRAEVVRHDAHPADALHTCADLRRANEHLGYWPTVELESGLRTLVPELVQAQSET